jgi:hypothetical protein
MEFPDRSGPWDRHTGAIGILRIKFVPEPNPFLVLIYGVLLLAVFNISRKEKIKRLTLQRMKKENLGNAV